MPGHRIGAEAARGGLAAPVERGHCPADAVPVIERFHIFFKEITPPRHEQEGAAGVVGGGPVGPADRPAI